MTLVYCEHITPRIAYIFSFFLGDMLGFPFRLTDDQGEFARWHGPKFSYSASPLGDEIHFRPDGLLMETITTPRDIRISRWNGLPVFFQVGAPSAWPFDPFAMAFFLVSRYEEYLFHRADLHGRFTAESSLAHREGFLDMPLVNLLGRRFRDLVKNHFPQLDCPEPSFIFIPTFDIDIAYAHLGKGLLRATAAWFRLMLKRDMSEIRERWSVMLGRSADPFDNFDLHLKLARENGLQLKYFVLLGNFGKYDRNISHRNRRFRALLRRLSLSAETGIHPSYRSHLDLPRIKLEVKRLQKITGRPVTNSRFHYLRMKCPESYRHILEAGITDDYSMGYASVNGFRASTCTPFYFFDLGRNEQTSLKVHPFIFMDTAMADHMKLTPEQARGEMEGLVQKVREYGGEAVGVWHNYALGEKGPYSGWQDVLRFAFKKFK